MIHKHISLFLSFFILFASNYEGLSQNIPNPVIPGIADAGVIKYNGKYYIGGVFTNGDFHISEDLVNWTGPVHVIDMDNEWTAGTGAGNDQIHANDMIYLNGKFHLYWSVNYWGKDKHAVHIVHAEANDILGPYREPVKETWMDNRIDPQVFKDDDGKLYMYMVRFTDGNTIWVRPMKDPYTFAGHPICQFASLPGTWETMDNRVAEGPWVIKYRGKYYMMYNANHTGTDWGNYQLGVAQADSPTAFNNGNKYPYPLLLSNQTLLEEKYPDILRINKEYNPDFKYTADVPDKNWTSLNFDDVTWKQGEGGFSSTAIEGSTTRYQGTEWTSPQIYLRKEFSTDKTKPGNLALRVLHEGDTKIYLNGKVIYDKTGADYRIHNLTKEEAGALKNGNNLLAVESKKGNRRSYINVALFDMKEDTADDILYSPGQPNIVRGPNGFEWWLVYMANKNREPRSQYINRIYFHDKTMYADNLTSTNTKGYFPQPTKPTYAENSEQQLSPGSERLCAGKEKSSYYLIESGVKTSGKAGIIAIGQDSDNRLKVGLNKADHTWFIEECINKKTQIQSYKLPDDFKFGVYHSLRIERNGGNISIKIDGIPAPGNPEIITSWNAESIPGLFSEEETAYFEGTTFTVGWDEYDNKITGWGDSRNGEKATGNFSVGSEGLTASSDNFQVFKGDMLSQYEFSTQITNKEDKGKSGIYPVYIDKDNYVKAIFDYTKQSLEIIHVSKGKPVKSDSYKPEEWKTHYCDVKYTDMVEKGYTFETPVQINGIRLNRHAHENKNLFIDNMFDKVSAEYKYKDKWHPVPISTIQLAENPTYNEASFSRPIKADALRFINKEAQDLNPYIYKIRVKEIFKDSYNIRCVKLNDQLIIFVDGKQITSLPIDNRPAQVGLLSEGAGSSFNGILRYQLP